MPIPRWIRDALGESMAIVNAQKMNLDGLLVFQHSEQGQVHRLHHVEKHIKHIRRGGAVVERQLQADYGRVGVETAFGMQADRQSATEAVDGLPVQLDDKGRALIDVPDDTSWTG